MDIEVTGARPVPPPRPPRFRGAVYLVLAVAAGAAFGFTAAGRQPAPRAAAVLAPAAPSASAGSPGLPADLRDRMLERVRQYNKPEPDAVEVSDVRLMTAQRGNAFRLDDTRSYPAGDYRLQVICLGDGQIWALLRIGDDESFVNMDCHHGNVLVTQVLLTAHADGRRAVTLVSDSPLGLAVGFQVLRRT